MGPAVPGGNLTLHARLRRPVDDSVGGYKLGLWIWDLAAHFFAWGLAA